MRPSPLLVVERGWSDRGLRLVVLLGLVLASSGACPGCAQTPPARPVGDAAPRTIPAPSVLDGAAAETSPPVSGCGATAAPFCLMDPPYAAAWESGTGEVWIVESDPLETSAKRLSSGAWSTFVLPVRGALAGLWGSGPADVWAVGAAGAIVRWDGAAWSLVPSATNADLSAVWGSGPTDAWAVGDASIVHWDGSAWSPAACCSSEGGAAPSLLGVGGSGPSDVWAVGAIEGGASGASPYAAHWDGTTWSNVDVSAADGPVRAVWVNAPRDVWLASGRTLLHVESSTITPYSLFGTIASLWGSAADRVWAVGAQGAIDSWDGQAWTSVESGTSNDLASVAGRGSDVWAVGGAGTVAHATEAGWRIEADGSMGPLEAVGGASLADAWTSGPLHWDGARWSADPATHLPALSICGVAAGDVWASGESLAAQGGSGLLAHWDGAAWSVAGIDGVYAPSPSGVDSALGPSSMRSLFCSSSSDVWAVGQVTAVTGPVVTTAAHWDGSTWRPVVTPTSAALEGVWGSAADDVWAAGDGGTLLHWDGTSWTVAPSGVSEDLGPVWGSAANDVWVGMRAGAQILHWDGSAWSVAPVASTALFSLWGAANDDVWGVGTDASGGVVVHWDGAQWSAFWNAPAAAGPLTGVWGDGGRLFVVARGGDIFTAP